jgi:hypothetical protein
MAYCPQNLYNFRRGQFSFQGAQRGNPLLINILRRQRLRKRIAMLLTKHLKCHKLRKGKQQNAL